MLVLLLILRSSCIQCLWWTFFWLLECLCSVSHCYKFSILNVVFQVALIVFLSHIGSFVPADAATVGLTDRSLIFRIPASFLKKKYLYSMDHIKHYSCNRIFCATGSKLMTAEQSTFMIDLHQVGMMLR